MEKMSYGQTLCFDIYFLIYFSLQSYGIGSIISPSLQTRKLKLREVPYPKLEGEQVEEPSYTMIGGCVA